VRLAGDVADRRAGGLPAPDNRGPARGGDTVRGRIAVFSVTATGTSLSYQWRKGAVNIGGATGSTYTIAAVAAGDAGSYDCAVSGACGSPVTSQAATLTVNSPPTITGQPSGATKNVGESVTFSVAATGTSLSYQWRKGAVNIGGATGAVTPLRRWPRATPAATIA